MNGMATSPRSPEDLSFEKHGQAGRELAARIRQQRTVAELGELALASPDVSAMLDEAVERVARALEVEFCMILEFVPEQTPERRALLKASKGYAGPPAGSLVEVSEKDYALLCREAVLFCGPDEKDAQLEMSLLRKHGVISGVSVALRDRTGLLGALGAHTARSRTFSREDVDFLKAVANTVAAALVKEQAEEESRESGQRFRSLIRHSSDIVTILRADGTISYASPAVETILGYEVEELVGSNAFAYVHPEDAERVSRTFEENLSIPGSHSFVEFRLRKADGSWGHFEVVGNNLRDDPSVRGVVVNSREITERKRAEEALAQTLRAKTDFIAEVSHELQAPLTVLRGSAELGLNLDCTCPHTETLRRIMGEAARMSRMIEDLMFLAHSDAASPPLEPETVEISDFLSGIRERAKRLTEQRGSKLNAALDGEGRALFDPAKIEQAILNLVNNAAKYGPPGGVVTLSSEIGDEGLRLEVVDQGPGIPDEELPRVFERFYRTSHREPEKRGSGLGLPITKTIVEAHGGRIAITSRSGSGTRVSLCLPLSNEGHYEDPPPRSRG